MFCCRRGELPPQVCRQVLEAGAEPHPQGSGEEPGGARPPWPAGAPSTAAQPGTKGAMPQGPWALSGAAAAGGEQTEARGQLQMEAGRGIGQG